MHNLFIKHVFRLEEKKYEEERIDYSAITFTDNQNVIDLISKKRTGSRRGGASADRRLAERHQGSSSQVSPGLLPAAGDGVLPVHSGGRGLRNGRDSDRDNNFRRGVDKYRYGGKTPRDYNFERPFRLRESGDR